jgi:uncharacterized FAD-dependent dehydrogenase
MMYSKCADGYAQAEMEADILNNKHKHLGTGRTWKVVEVMHVGWRETVETPHYTPREVTETRDERDSRIRRTMYHG